MLEPAMFKNDDALGQTTEVHAQMRNIAPPPARGPTRPCGAELATTCPTLARTLARAPSQLGLRRFLLRLLLLLRPLGLLLLLCFGAPTLLPRLAERVLPRVGLRTTVETVVGGKRSKSVRNARTWRRRREAIAPASSPGASRTAPRRRLRRRTRNSC